MSYDERHFICMSDPTVRTVVTATAEVATVMGQGSVRVTGCDGVPVVLTDVLYVPSFTSCLISVSRIFSAGGHVQYARDGQTVSIFSRTSTLPVLIAKRSEDLWKVRMFYPSEGASETSHTTVTTLSPAALSTRGERLEDSVATLDVWHERLGHLGWSQLRRIFSHDMVRGASVSDLGSASDKHECFTCLEGKMTELPFPTSESKVSKPFERIHMDLMGPMERQSITGHHRYVMVLVDEYTRYGWVYFLGAKSEASKRIVEFFSYVERQYLTKIQQIRSDRGGEFLSNDLSEWLAEQGVVHQLSIAQTPQQNGIAERYNRTLTDRGRSMLISSGLSLSYWEYCLRYACWVTNRVPTSSLPNGGIPYEVLHGKKPNLAMARRFGCLAHVWVPKDQRSKFGKRSVWGVFLGVSIESKGWIFHLLDSGVTGHLSRNVVFHEQETIMDYRARMRQPKESRITDPFPPYLFLYQSTVPSSVTGNSPGESGSSVDGGVGAIPTSDSDTVPDASGDVSVDVFADVLPSLDERDASHEDIALTHDDVLVEPVDVSGDLPSRLVSFADEVGLPLTVDEPMSGYSRDTVSTVRRSERARRPPLLLEPTRSGHSHSYKRGYALTALPVQRWKVPTSLAEARSSDVADSWEEAMHAEKSRLDEMCCWELVDCPPGANVLGSKWVYALKLKPDQTIDRYKARLVVQGFGQKQDIDYDDTFASTAGKCTIRMFLALVCQLGLHCTQLDVTTAFLYGFVDKDIYMRQPPGFGDGTGRVCRLVRSLYGLKQAPRIWQEKLRSALLLMGFKSSDMDPNLYFLVRDGHTLFLLDYVDDMLVASKDLKLVDWVKNQLINDFKITDMGEVQKYVGFEVCRDKENGKMWLHQATFIKEMVEKYNLFNGHIPDSPLPSTFVLHEKWELEGEEPPLGAPDDPPLTETEQLRLRKLVGSLNFVAHTTRLDVAFAVNQLSRSQHKPRKRHLAAAERVVRYLVGTSEWGLHFDANKGTTLQCYVDANYHHNTEKKSMTGFLLLLGGGPIHWTSKKQEKITTSSCDAECHAIQTAVQYVEACRDQLEEFGCLQMHPTVVFNDNTAAVRLCVDAVAHKRSVQMTKAMAFVRERYAMGVINPQHVGTVVMAADFLTKNMAVHKMSSLRRLAGMASLPEDIDGAKKSNSPH